MQFSRANLARGTVWNFLGQGAPILVAIFAIPELIESLGTDRFGVLVLVWMFIGYFSLFDLGIGRALTQIVARRLVLSGDQQVSGVVWTGLLLMGLLGVAGASLILFAAPSLVSSHLRIPDQIRHETLLSLRILALAIPAVVLTAGLAGVLAAKQRFDIINMLRLPMGVYTFIAPWVVVQFSGDLVLISSVLAFGRMAFLLLHLLLCLAIAPGLRRPLIEVGEVRPLLQFGSWMTVSNVVGPLMVYLDRFIIGMVISMSAVAYYATPYEVVTRLWIIPTAVVAVLFPAFASLHESDLKRLADLFDRGLRYMLLVMFPLVLAIVAFASQGLEIWLGEEFAKRSTAVLRWLAVGVFVNSVSQVAFALVQGIGRPDLSAKAHLVQLPLYLAALWIFLHQFGIEGAAMVWTMRVALDGVMLLAAVAWIEPGCRKIVQRLWLYLFVATGLLAGLATLQNTTVVTAAFVVLLLSFCRIAWRQLMAPDEQDWLLRKFQRAFKR